MYESLSGSLKPPRCVETHWRLDGCLIVFEMLQQEMVHISRLADLHFA